MVLDDSDKDKAFGTDGSAPKAQPEDTSDVGGDGTPLNPKDSVGVQFIQSGRDPLNGDAKVEIGDTIAVQFVGLGKEELMKYANDPFWVRLRWALFILFWIIWLAMLVGAIIIIVLAPKCKEPKSIVEQIVENGPYYQIDLKSFSPGANLQGLKDKSTYLKNLGVNTVIISDIVDKSDLTRVSPESGDTEELKNIIKEFNKNDIKVLLQLIPNHSGKQNPWFVENPEYYVMIDKEEAGKSTWKTVPDPMVSAWTPMENSTKSYLHQFGPENPDFDFKNEGIMTKMNEILKHWYKEVGVNGFLLSAVSYLKENTKDLTNQNATINQDGNRVILEKILNTKNWELGEGGSDPYALLDVDGLSASDAITQYGGKVFTPITNVDLPREFNVRDLEEEFKSVDGKFPIRRLSAPGKERIGSKYSGQRVNILALMAYFTKGQVVWYYGDEAGLTEKTDKMKFGAEANSQLLNFYNKAGEVVKKVKKSGDEKIDIILKNDTEILAFKRDSYVVVVNLGNQDENVDVINLLSLDNTGALEVVLSTPGANVQPVSEGSFRLPPMSGVVLHYHKHSSSETTPTTTA